jgi:hypothetical protein
MPKSGLRPHTWKIGTDPIDHRLYIDCLRARAQATYRGEQWLITEQEYISLWRTEDRYLQKGRGAECVCLIRCDHTQPWTVNNVKFISRLEHFRTTHLHKARRKLDKQHESV